MGSTLLSQKKAIPDIVAHDLVFSEAFYPAGSFMSAHQHSKSQIVLVLSGAVEHQVGSDRHCISEKSGGFVPRGEKHSDLFLGDVHAFQIELSERHHKSFPDSYVYRALPRNHPSITLLNSAVREFRNRDNYTATMLEALTMELLVSLHRQSGHTVCGGNQRWLDRARDLLHEEFSETLSLDDIALEVGVHPSHLTKAFRRRFGQSIGEYVRQLRVARARHLLEVSDMSLGEIAISTGFADQGHFTRTFKKYTGMTPMSCRRALS